MKVKNVVAFMLPYINFLQLCLYYTVLCFKKTLLLPTCLGDVAQLVEQRTENPCVTGSIPVITTKNTASDVQ